MEKTTGTLTSILRKTSPKDIDHFLEENRDSMITDENPFAYYMRNAIKRKGLTQQEVFNVADISESYGYKLISGEKHTKQRDIILRLCIGSHLDLDETQQALQLYGFSALYPRIQRDALLIVQILHANHDIYSINSYLEEYGVEPLQNTAAEK